MRGNAVQFKSIEAEVKHRAGGLSRVSLTPPVASYPETQLGLPVLLIDVSQTNRPDQGTRRGQANRKSELRPTHSFLSLLLYPTERVVNLIRMGNRQGRVSNLTSPGKPLDFRGIVKGEPSEDQSIGPQSRFLTHGVLVGVLLRLLYALA